MQFQTDLFILLLNPFSSFYLFDSVPRKFSKNDEIYHIQEIMLHLNNRENDRSRILEFREFSQR